MTEFTPLQAHDADARATPTDPMTLLSTMMTAQALSLDAIFADLLRHATAEMEDWPGAAQNYARLAFRAQSNCRMSLDAAARADRSARQSEEVPHK